MVLCNAQMNSIWYYALNIEIAYGIIQKKRRYINE
jgi:hypothetical protein